MDLPKGIDINVPDLSQLGKVQPDVVVASVRPGDRVIVLLPILASQQEVQQVSQYLKQWAPQTEFCVLSGPLSVTVIPGDPVVDKEPQGDVDLVKPVTDEVEDATVYPLRAEWDAGWPPQDS